MATISIYLMHFGIGPGCGSATKISILQHGNQNLIFVRCLNSSRTTLHLSASSNGSDWRDAVSALADVGTQICDLGESSLVESISGACSAVEELLTLSLHGKRGAFLAKVLCRLPPRRLAELRMDKFSFTAVGILDALGLPASIAVEENISIEEFSHGFANLRLNIPMTVEYLAAMATTRIAYVQAERAHKQADPILIEEKEFNERTKKLLPFENEICAQMKAWWQTTTMNGPAANFKNLRAATVRRKLEDSALVFGYLPPFEDTINETSGVNTE